MRGAARWGSFLRRFPCIFSSMAGKIVGRDRLVGVEIVVEPVVDGRADGDLCGGEKRLHRLGHHVRGGMPEHRLALGRVERDYLNRIVVVERRAQVHQDVVDFCGKGFPGKTRRYGGSEMGGSGAVGQRFETFVGQNNIHSIPCLEAHARALVERVPLPFTNTFPGNP